MLRKLPRPKNLPDLTRHRAKVLGVLVGLCLLGILWSQLSGLSASEIEKLALADLQDRAARNSETIAIKSIELQRTWLGKTPSFRFCDSIDRIIDSSRMYITGKAPYNPCDPILPVWQINLTAKWEQRNIPITHVYMVFTTGGKLVEAVADNVP
jgi:hypothetical protein